MRRLLPLLLTACSQVLPPSPAELPPDIALTGVAVHQYRGSELRLVATAPTLGFHREGPRAGQLVADSVTAESPAEGLRLEARRVSGDALGGVLTGESVRVTTSGGAVLQSPRATFDRSLGSSGTAATDAGLTVTHPLLSLEAEAGSFDLAAERADLVQPRTVFHAR